MRPKVHAEPEHLQNEPEIKNPFPEEGEGSTISQQKPGQCILEIEDELAVPDEFAVTAVMVLDPDPAMRQALLARDWVEKRKGYWEEAR